MPGGTFVAAAPQFVAKHNRKMDTLGFEPRAFRMRSGCDTTTPCAPCSIAQQRGISRCWNEKPARDQAELKRSRPAAGTKKLPTLFAAAIAQLGERQTEDLKVPGSIPGLGIFFRMGRDGRRGTCRPPVALVSELRSARCFAIEVAVSRLPNATWQMIATNM